MGFQEFCNRNSLFTLSKWSLFWQKSFLEASNLSRATRRFQIQRDFARQAFSCSKTLASSCEAPSWNMIWECKDRCEVNFLTEIWFRFATVNNVLRKLFGSPFQMVLCREWDRLSWSGRSDQIAWCKVALWQIRIPFASPTSDYFRA